jgi:hypothetical protein
MLAYGIVLALKANMRSIDEKCQCVNKMGHKKREKEGEEGFLSACFFIFYFYPL